MTRSCPSSYIANMEKNITLIIFVLLMVAVIVVVDVLFFRHRVMARLVANIGIVVIFALLYLGFLKR